MPQSLQKQLLVLRGLKLLLYIITFVTGLTLFRIENLGFYYTLGLLFAISVAWLFIYRWRILSVQTQAVVQLLLDVTFENVLIHFGGGVESPFIFLLVFNLFLGAYILPQRWMHAVGFYVAAFYAFFSYCAYRGFLPGFMVTENVFEINPDVTFYYLVFMRVFIFFMIGYLASQFSARIFSQEATIQRMHNLTEKILFQLGSGLITVDAADRVIYSNKTAADLLGISNMEILGRNWQHLFFPEGEFPEPAFLKQAASMRGAAVEVPHLKYGRVPVAITVSPVFDERQQPVGKTVIFRDLTQEREIERLRTEQKRIQTLEELSRTLAHEIKNPLASICGSLEVLNESHMYEDFQSKRMVQVILKESERLSRILKDFLTFSGEMNLRKQVVNLVTLVDDLFLVMKHNPQIPPAVSLVRDIPEGQSFMADIDRDLFSQLMVNLILNGAQSIPKEGEVRVQLQFARDEGGNWIHLVVRDTGEGIPQGVREDIFKPFFTMRPKGMGLGLNVCSKIIQQHGWQWDLESSEKTGTRFIIKIPKI